MGLRTDGGFVVGERTDLLMRKKACLNSAFTITKGLIKFDSLRVYWNADRPAGGGRGFS